MSTLQSLAVVLIALVLIWTYWRFRFDLLRFLVDYPSQVIILVLLFAMVYGQIGNTLGLPYLFWNEEPWPRFFAALGATLVLGLVGINAYYLIPRALQSMTMQRVEDFLDRYAIHLPIGSFLEPKDDPNHRNPYELSRFLRLIRLPFLTLLALPALLPGFFTTVPRYPPVISGTTNEPIRWMEDLYTVPDVNRDLGAYLIALLVWLAGVLMGVLLIKLGVLVSVWLGPRMAPIVRVLIRLFGPVQRWILKHKPPRQPTESTPTQQHGSRIDISSEKTRSIFTFFVIVVLFYILFSTLLYEFVAPGLAICVLLGLLAMVSVALAFIPSRWRLLSIAVLVAWIALANHPDFGYRFERLSYAEEDIVDLQERLRQGYLGEDPQSAVEGDIDPDPSGGTLIDDEIARDRWLAYCQQRREQAGGPKLVVVCVSGGATRSAYWSATVLDRLGREVPGFHDHVRIITGASGGMVGTSYYVTWLHDRPQEPPWIETIPDDSLQPVARYIALRSTWRMLLAPRWEIFQPRDGEAPRDRGIVLEQDWQALRRPLTDFHAAESEGRLPSLIFSPMTVEDGRRLLISNLDLRQVVSGMDRLPPPRPDRIIALNRGGELINTNPGALMSNYSLSALEFYKVFPPKDHELLLSTAARMSATFPFFSPGVFLPSDPPLRLVDAGYYDNYGVDVAAAWIFNNREWILCNTSGVILVQIRDTLSRDDRFGVPVAESTWAEIFKGLQFFFTPLDAVLQARYTSSSFRNDQQVGALSEMFTLAAGRRSFFTTVVFENTANVTLADGDRTWPGEQLLWTGEQLLKIPPDALTATDVAMNWYMTVAEKQALKTAIPGDPNAEPVGSQWNDPDRRVYRIKQIEYLDNRLSQGTHPDEALQSQLNLQIESLRILGRLLEGPEADRVDDLQGIGEDLAARNDRGVIRRYVLRELARARNFERLQGFKRWWDINHSDRVPDDPRM